VFIYDRSCQANRVHALDEEQAACQLGESENNDPLGEIAAACAATDVVLAEAAVVLTRM
jgi:hypothetical protein